MKTSLFLLFTFVLPLKLTFAQAELRTSNTDLRSSSVMFSLFKSGKKSETYKLLKSRTGQFMLNYFVEEKLTKRWKVDSESANEVDRLFTDKFVDMKYMMSEKLKTKCTRLYGLSMRDENLDICPADKVRVSEIEKILKKIKLDYI